MYLSLQQGFEAACLITIQPSSRESYMFHHPNIELTQLQASAIGLPIVSKQTTGRKEEELTDLADALRESKSKHGIEGIASGAIDSEYQKTRIDRITYEAGLKSFAPLWRKNPIQMLRSQFQSGFKTIICGVYAHGLNQAWLGRPLNKETIESLTELSQRFRIHPSGEGGEYESLVLDAPIFKRELHVDESSTDWDANSETGTFRVLRAHLESKGKR